MSIIFIALAYPHISFAKYVTEGTNKLFGGLNSYLACSNTLVIALFSLHMNDQMTMTSLLCRYRLQFVEVGLIG